MINKIAIIAGESNSINSEIVSKCWKKLKKKRNKIFLVGSYLLIKNQLKIIKINVPLKRIKNINNNISSSFLHILDVPVNFKNPFKLNKKDNAKYVQKCIDIGDNLAKYNKKIGFINCAINKNNVPALQKLGVTEYLARKSLKKITEVMMIYNEKLAVVPLTTHISVKHVAKKISKKLIKDKIITLDKCYKKILKKKPNIAILGLNPHNDEYRKYSEEEKIIIPSINNLKKIGIKVKGPFPADTAFGHKNIKMFDVIVGMYHDQVLAPFKALYKFNAINITLGLNYIRVSPDHGVASDIIKRNKADPKSLIKCINFICKTKL